MLFIWLFTGSCIPASAQEFDIRSFAADPSDLAARRYEKRTVNDEPAALVKVVTNIEGMFFDSNLGIVDVERKEAEYWVYIPPRERRIRLMAEGYLPLDINMPEPAREHMVYSMVVTTKPVGPRPTELVSLIFRMNENNVHIQQGENTPVLSTGSSVEYNLSKGEYSFRFIKEGFEEKEININLQESFVRDITLIPGESKTELTMGGMVVISSIPNGIDLFLNEQRVGQTPYQGRQLPGLYNLILQDPLYYDHTDQFILDEGAVVSLTDIELSPRFGYLELTSEPSEAEVYLNNDFLGITPIARREISSDNHEIIVKKTPYYDYRINFTIEDGDAKQFNVILEPNYGELIINSEPPNAKVSIAGREVGTTPYRNAQQPSGSYSIRLEKELFADGRRQAEVKDGEITELFFLLSSNYGSIEINAEGSNIFLNGELVGTDSYMANLSAGRYIVKAEKEGHIDHEREITIFAGETERITLLPRPKLGALSIITHPFETRGAEIYLNGERRTETTPAVILLHIGTYELRVRKPGYTDIVKRVIVDEDLDKEIIIDMPERADLPKVSIIEIHNIGAGAVEATSQVINESNLPVIEHGICWSTRPHPTIVDYCLSTGSGSGFFTRRILGLEENKDYFFRPYAINNISLVYGDQNSLRTISDQFIEGVELKNNHIIFSPHYGSKFLKFNLLYIFNNNFFSGFRLLIGGADYILYTDEGIGYINTNGGGMYTYKFTEQYLVGAIYGCPNIRMGRFGINLNAGLYFGKNVDRHHANRHSYVIKEKSSIKLYLFMEPGVAFYISQRLSVNMNTTLLPYQGINGGISLYLF